LWSLVYGQFPTVPLCKPLIVWQVKLRDTSIYRWTKVQRIHVTLIDIATHHHSLNLAGGDASRDMTSRPTCACLSGSARRSGFVPASRAASAPSRGFRLGRRVRRLSSSISFIVGCGVYTRRRVY